MGARRRKTSGAIRAATSQRLGGLPPASMNQPEHSTNSTTAITTSTQVA